MWLESSAGHGEGNLGKSRNQMGGGFLGTQAVAGGRNLIPASRTFIGSCETKNSKCNGCRWLAPGASAFLAAPSFVLYGCILGEDAHWEPKAWVVLMSWRGQARC